MDLICLAPPPPRYAQRKFVCTEKSHHSHPFLKFIDVVRQTMTNLDDLEGASSVICGTLMNIEFCQKIGTDLCDSES